MSQATNDAGLAAKANLQANNTPKSDPIMIDALYDTFQQRNAEAFTLWKSKPSTPGLESTLTSHLLMLMNIRDQLKRART